MHAIMHLCLQLRRIHSIFQICSLLEADIATGLLMRQKKHRLFAQKYRLCSNGCPSKEACSCIPLDWVQAEGGRSW